MTPDALEGGFVNPPLNAAHAFRAALTALSRPGQIVTVTGVEPPAPLSVAAGVLVLTLADGTTPVHLAGAHDCPALRDWITFHTGAPFVGQGDCAFALGTWAALGPLAAYPVGTPDYPDRSATLIVEMPDLRAGGAVLTGPGIRDRATFALPEIAAFQANAEQFPLGLDFFFTSGAQVAALPRSTRVRVTEEVH